LPRKQTSGLTDAELRLMEVLWHRGPSTVAEVVQSLADQVSLAYSTVLTTLRILENKGHIEHHADGRTFIYTPITQRDAARENAVALLVRRFFQGSPELLVLSLTEGKKIDAKQLARLRKRIEEEEKS
jgi:predicted transcriptional regulator